MRADLSFATGEPYTPVMIRMRVILSMLLAVSLAVAVALPTGSGGAMAADHPAVAAGEPMAGCDDPCPMDGTAAVAACHACLYLPPSGPLVTVGDGQSVPVGAPDEAVRGHIPPPDLDPPRPAAFA